MDLISNAIGTTVNSVAQLNLQAATAQPATRPAATSRPAVADPRNNPAKAREWHAQVQAQLEYLQSLPRSTQPASALPGFVTGP